MVIYGHEISNIYLFGVLGSLGVELAAALKSVESSGSFSRKYHQKLYLFLRLLFAFVAGSVPLALDASNMWAALYLGASAPLIFDRASRGLENEPRALAG